MGRTGFDFVLERHAFTGRSSPTEGFAGKNLHGKRTMLCKRLAAEQNYRDFSKLPSDVLTVCGL